MPERLQKILAQAGVGSRRACEQMILQGRVTVNGRVVDRLPVLVEPGRDDVRMDGRPIASQRNVYYLLNKPRGVVCTNRDPAGRPRAIDLLSHLKERLFCVGRLDEDSEGLLLLTNDGQLAQRLMHPRYGVPKTYRLLVRGRPAAETIETLRKGVWLGEGRTQPANVKLIYRSTERTILQITLREGRNRQVRRMLARAGHPVRRLKRVAMGQLTIQGLRTGRYRPLTASEVRYLQSLAAGAR